MNNLQDIKIQLKTHAHVGANKNKTIHDNLQIILKGLFTVSYYENFLPPDNGALIGNATLFYVLGNFGKPILLAPNRNHQEQLVTNRLITQNARVLLFPNKYSWDNRIELVSTHDAEFTDNLPKIIIPNKFKDELTKKLKQIYNINTFYPDAMNNFY